MNAKANCQYPTSRVGLMAATFVGLMMWFIVGLMIWLGLASVAKAEVATCRDVTANVVAIDQPVMFNRMGASNINATIFALRRDTVVLNAVVSLPVITAGGDGDVDTTVLAGSDDVQVFAPGTTGLAADQVVITPGPDGMLQTLIALGDNAANISAGADTPLTAIPDAQLAGFAGNVALRRDKRPRPLVLRIRVDDCLTINLTNLLAPAANPNAPVINPPPIKFTTLIDDQVADRNVSLHVNGLQWVNGSQDDGSSVGNNPDSTVAQSATKTYKLYAEKEGAYAARGLATTVGSDANQGNSSNLLLGEVIVEPVGAAIYRGQVTEEEMRLAADWNGNGMIDPFDELLQSCAIHLPPCNEQTADGHPIINYEVTYPNDCPTTGVWCQEGKANLPVLNMIDVTVNEIVHSEINALVAHGPNGKVEGNGHFPTSTYPLENQGKRNPTVPNRLEPFRDFASIFHDEPATKQAFPGFYEPTLKGGDDVFRYVLEGVKDGFMINYGSGGIGSEIIANRLRVGPMHDCLTCAFEEFFLTSFTVSDPATLVDVPANVGLEGCKPNGTGCPATAMGPKATKGIYTEDPANIHHSYTGDFTKFRNVHIGKEQHVFHLHNHQWLYNPNDDNSNYLDAQGIGPGVGYTYEINFGGSGNRNKTSGDAIFHCHFYPHFAQGMWYHWRHHDVFERGTVLAVSGAGPANVQNPMTFHSTPFALFDGTPEAGARALPDGEVVVGLPIPAVVPLPGKPMAPMPGLVTVKANPLTTTASAESLTTVDLDPTTLGNQVPVGSLASIPRNPDGSLMNPTANPGYPFWIAGIEDVVGQRPPTPPLDMLNHDQAHALRTSSNPLWADIREDQADGWDGGLPRAALEGYAAGGASTSVVTKLDFSKVVEVAQGVFYPEEGTDLEQLAMDYHSQRNHPTCLPDGSCGVNFVLNGSPPAVGAPFHEPCIDDNGLRLGATGVNTPIVGHFFDGTPGGTSVTGASIFNAEHPRIYKGANIQYDAVFNKAGYHYPQQRIIALWQDAVPVITKEKPGQPMLLRLNTFDCAVYHHTNLVPEVYEVDDYQVRTPTDIIGQHIHLPKWDLTTADGAANGWNYEDGTLSPGAVQERIVALNTFKNAMGSPGHRLGTGSLVDVVPTDDLTPLPHPYFSTVAPSVELANHWLGARTTTQRWFADPVVNTGKVDRGLGIIFSHDHYGPSTHQQIGLYATVLAEPAGSAWVHNETGDPLGYDASNGTPRRTFTIGTRVLSDGGPTAWQAAILPPGHSGTVPTGLAYAESNTLEPFREFYIEYSDFQHAYEAGVYVGAGQHGEPLPGTGPDNGPIATSTGNLDFETLGNDPGEAFRFAINPPARAQIAPVFPDLVLEVGNNILPGCPTRPCPQAIDVQDPGMLVLNYRNEPLGLRIYDPQKPGPDGNPGMQADGPAGDLAFALANKDTAGNNIIRKFEVPVATSNLGTSPPPLGPGGTGYQVLNFQPKGGQHINGTVFPPPINSFQALKGGDPFTPMVRTMAGDSIRVKLQAGAHEEEHNAAIHGMKWLQAGSGHGKAPNSGWRNAQAGGISEQFTFYAPVWAAESQTGNSVDHAYVVNNAGNDGWWSGMWGITRVYGSKQNDLFMLPSSVSNAKITNQANFVGTCPAITTKQGKGKNAITVTTVKNPRPYDVTAVLANEVLPDNPDVGNASGNIVDPFPTGHVGNHPLHPAGGTLVYNPRVTSIDANHSGPIHDPTAILYVRTEDLHFNTACLATNSCRTELGDPDGLQAGAPIEPLVLRAAAGECLLVTLRNALPPLTDVVVPVIDPATGSQAIDPGTLLPMTQVVQNATMPDLATYSTMMGVVKRDRFGAQGSTTFQTNLMRPSGYVGLHPQLVEFDASRDNGILVGANSNTLDLTLTPPGSKKTYAWYAGHIEVKVTTGRKTTFELYDHPLELGGSNLQPADVIKQGMKSLVGQLVIEPEGSAWTEGAGQPAFTRTVADVGPDSGGGSPSPVAFRDLSTVWTKGLTHYWADGSPVEHLNGEQVGLPEDAQEASGMAINYSIEPLWLRLGLLPNAPFSPEAGVTSFADVTQFNVFSSLVHGDPATPVFIVAQDTPFRMRVTNPYGTSRGTTFQLNGYVWPRDPYVCPGETREISLVGACLPDDGNPSTARGIGSRAIGVNPLSFHQGGQESITPSTHFDIVPTSPGLPGDHLFRDAASFGNASGLWGIVRVE